MQRDTMKKTGWLLALASFLTLPAACSGGDASPPPSGACSADQVFVTATILRDERTGEARDYASALLTRSDNPEVRLQCDATVTLVVGSQTTTLEETQPGQFEAGYSETDPGLPPLTLSPGAEHTLQIDLGSDGSVDVTGVVVLSDVTDFAATVSTPSQAAFAWNDGGDVANTTYYVQATDKQDFVFPDHFCSGLVVGLTTIGFGGTSEAPYFTADPPFYARIQTDTAGSLSSDGRLDAWAWPVEPILQYQ
jgi:hypothetical protein